MPILPQHNLCRHLQSQSQDFKSSTGVVPAPVMAFSLPRAHKPCSFTSRGLIFPPYSKEADKELPLPSTEAQTHMHLSLQGQAHLPGRKKKAGSCLESTAGLALGHTSQRWGRQTGKSLPLLPDCQFSTMPTGASPDWSLWPKMS